MAVVKKEFILEKIEELQYPYFVVWAPGKKERIYQNLNDPDATSSKAKAQLIEFFNNTSGNVEVTIQLKSAMNQGDTREKCHYTTYCNGSESASTAAAPITGIVNNSRELDLQAKLYEEKLNNLREQHRRDLEMVDLKRQISDLKEGDFFSKHGETIAGILPMLFSGRAPVAPVAAVAGIPPEEEGSAMAILDRLSKVDPEYLSHLSMLATLAETNIDLYKQGIEMIQKFV